MTNEKKCNIAMATLVAVLILGVCAANAFGQLPGQQIDDAIGDLQEWQVQHQWEYQEVLQELDALRALHAPPVEPPVVEPPDPVDPPPVVVPPEPPVGVIPGAAMNLNEVTEYGLEWNFKNLVLRARQRGDWWYLFQEANGRYPGGAYTFTYEGDGTVTFTGDAVVTSSEPGVVHLLVTPTDVGVRYQFPAQVTPKTMVLDSLANTSSSFHPLWLKRLEPFGTIRFMDWQQTNYSNQVHPDDMPQADDTQRGGSGVALAYMIEVCNTLQANPWFCMPHAATDEYVREFATQVRNGLHPNAVVYVEWSNEVWNAQFGGSSGQYTYVKDLAGGVDLGNNAFFKAWGDEAKLDFAVWREVFAGQLHRVKFVCAGQQENPWVTSKILAQLPRTQVLSAAGYFGVRGRDVDSMRGASVQTLHAYLSDRITGPLAGFHLQHQAMAGDRAYMLYEAGQHLVTSGDPQLQAYLDIQSDPLIVDLYRKNMAGFEAAGVDMVAWFNYISKRNRNGAWGHLTYQNSPLTGNGALKYNTILERSTQ